ncbi:MAG: hypothetical protein VKL59_07575 [Nostocaceae cyanobacterium]|nr:hypothetical protein [Nostocaceae cyanobacterium]
MTLTTNGRNQPYEIFLQEARLILWQIQTILQDFPSNHGLAKIYTLVRTVNELQEKATAINLTDIALMAQRLKDIFRCLGKETLSIDTEMIDLLLDATECLHQTLFGTMQVSQSKMASRMAQTEEIFTRLEARFSICLQTQTNTKSNIIALKPLKTKDPDKDIILANQPLTAKLTLKTAQFFIWDDGTAICSVPYNHIEESLFLKPGEIIQSRQQEFLHWKQQMIQVYHLSELMRRHQLLSTQIASQPSNQTELALVINQGQRTVALASVIQRLVTEPELPLIPPSITNGLPTEASSHCLIGYTLSPQDQMVPVINVLSLVK